MLKTKLPSTRLSLHYEFELPGPVVQPSSSAHDAACKKAAALSGLAPPDAVAARAVVKRGLDLKAVHAERFDPEFHVAKGGPALRYEFYYDPAAPKLIVRIVTSLGEEPSNIVDGVSASRIALHAMEVLEGAESIESIFPKHPPLVMGLRNHLLFMYHVMPGMLIRVALAYFSMLLDNLLPWRRYGADVTLVSDAKSLFRYYNSKHAADPADFHLFTPGREAFKEFLTLVDVWRAAVGFVGYHYLINFSPLVAPGITTQISHVRSQKERYARAFAPPGAAPPPNLWRLNNPCLAKLVFINNYGVHKHNFKATPVAYVWDWLELAAPIAGAGCITINGVFMCWVRGTTAQIEKGPFADKLGAPRRLSQNTTWFTAMGGA